MLKIIKRSSYPILIGSVLLVIGLSLAYSFAQAESVNCGTNGWPDSSCTGLPGGSQDITGILKNIMQWLLGIVGILGIISFAVSGFMYLMAGVNEKMSENAKNGMVFSIIGIIVALSGLIIINAIFNALQGTPSF